MNYERTINEIQRMIKDADELVSALSKAVDALRRLSSAPQNIRVPGKRGRKSMGEEERKEVSHRMSKYWAVRRRQDLADQTTVEQNMRSL